MVDILGINLSLLYGTSYSMLTATICLKLNRKKKKKRKDFKITSFATPLKPYGTIIFLPTIYSMCVCADKQPWNHRAKHML